MTLRLGNARVRPYWGGMVGSSAAVTSIPALPDERLAKIDSVRIGHCTGNGSERTSNQRTASRAGARYGANDGSRARANCTARQGALARTIAATGKAERESYKSYRQEEFTKVHAQGCHRVLSLEKLNDFGQRAAAYRYTHR